MNGEGSASVVEPASVAVRARCASEVRLTHGCSPAEAATRLAQAASTTLTEHALRAPGAAWVSPERAALMESDDERIPHLCPDFVVEIRSPSDRLSDQRAKLELWIEHGARLGWLIDPFGGVAYICWPDQSPGAAQPARIAWLRRCTAGTSR